jgi:hypothetical protein
MEGTWQQLLLLVIIRGREGVGGRCDVGWHGHDDVDVDGSAHGREESIWNNIYGYDESSSTTHYEEDEDGRYDLKNHASPFYSFIVNMTLRVCVLFLHLVYI